MVSITAGSSGGKGVRGLNEGWLPSTTLVKGCSTLYRVSGVRNNWLLGGTILRTETTVSTGVLNTETSGPPLTRGSQNVGPSSYTQEFGKFFSGESDQPKRKELKILISEVLQLKNSTMLSYRKVHSQQVALGIQSFLLAFYFSYLNMSRQSRISKHLRILYGIPLKRRRRKLKRSLELETW